jgi:D-amino-acid oxidase
MSTKSNRQVAIVGSGIIGLTSGIRLLEAGFEVTVFSKDRLQETTSSVAAALWHPGGAGEEPIKRWCQTGLNVFRELSKDSESGIKFVNLYELSDHMFHDTGLELAGDLKPLEQGLFPEPWNFGYSLSTARINVPSYLPFLVKKFKTLSGQIKQEMIHDLASLSPFEIIVNASGIGAKELANDEGIYPIRGQIIRVAKPQGLSDDIIHIHTGTTFTYIVPRESDCILGGTYQINDFNRTPDREVARAILERTGAINPAFENPDILEHKVGLRPGRDTVRLELEHLNDSLVIHNYGHGSIGHTLAWGCAAEVVDLVTSRA